MKSLQARALHSSADAQVSTPYASSTWLANLTHVHSCAVEFHFGSRIKPNQILSLYFSSSPAGRHFSSSATFNVWISSLLSRSCSNHSGPATCFRLTSKPRLFDLQTQEQTEPVLPCCTINLHLRSSLMSKICIARPIRTLVSRV